MSELWLLDVVFWLFCLVTVGGALYVLLSTHVLYAAYGLMVSFLGVAGIFVFAGAETVAASQIMVYVGGILVLLVFGIMLSSRKKEGNGHLAIENAPRGLGLLLVVVLSAVLFLLVGKLRFPGQPAEDWLSIKAVGLALMTDYVIILELLGMLLLMALVAATYLAKDDQ